MANATIPGLTELTDFEVGDLLDRGTYHIAHDTYVVDDSPCLTLLDQDGELAADITVCVPGSPARHGHVWVKEYDCPGIMAALADRGILRTTGKGLRVGRARVEEALLLTPGRA